MLTKSRLLGHYELYTSEGIDRLAEEFFDILIERIHSSESKAAKSFGDSQIGIDPKMSEWGNPAA